MRGKMVDVIEALVFHVGKTQQVRTVPRLYCADWSCAHTYSNKSWPGTNDKPFRKIRHAGVVNRRNRRLPFGLRQAPSHLFRGVQNCPNLAKQ
jgi:hypothetical protein